MVSEKGTLLVLCSLLSSLSRAIGVAHLCTSRLTIRNPLVMLLSRISNPLSRRMASKLSVPMKVDAIEC